MRRIAITGPESSGKSDLSQQLARHFNTLWVPEFARTYLQNLSRPYTAADLTTIAEGQLRTENQIAQQARLQGKSLIFCDTDFLVLKVWSEVRYGRVSPTIQRLWLEHDYTHTLLAYPDLPWQDDPQREHPNQRMELYQRYLTALQLAKRSFTIVKGLGQERTKCVIDAVDRALKHNRYQMPGR